MIKKTLLFFCLYLFISSSIAQNYHYRVSADFTIKESDGNIDNLTAGKVYYDLNNDILVYNMYFPEKIDSTNPAEARTTIIGRMRQWTSSRLGPRALLLARHRASLLHTHAGAPALGQRAIVLAVRALW